MKNLNGFKEELLTEVKLLIKSEVYDSVLTQLQKRIKNWRMKKASWNNMKDACV